MKRLVTLEITNDDNFTSDDICGLVMIGASEECDDQFDTLAVKVVEDSEIALCEKCGQYMDTHSVWNECPPKELLG